MSDKKGKTGAKQVEAGTPSKGNSRNALESVLRQSMMHMLDSYEEDEIMSLYERVKAMYDIVRTRTLVLPRDKRLTAEEREYMAEAMAHLAKTEDGVVEGDEEDDEDVDQIDSESDSEEDDEKINAYIKLFKKRLVLTDMHESQNTAEDDDFLDMDEMELDDAEDESDSSEEAPAKSGKKSLAVSKRPVVAKESDSEESGEEAGEDDLDELDGLMDEDGLVMSRNFMVNFSLLNAEGKIAATDLVLESSDVYGGEGGFQGTHQLTWNDDVVFSLNVVDGDITEPEMPDFDEDMDDEEMDDSLLEGALPNVWDEDAALALKIASGFPEELTPVQFVVILTRVMSRIIKNATRSPGPAPADGLLPFLVLELTNKENEDDDAADLEAEEAEEDEESSEEEVAPPKKAAPAAAKGQDKKHDKKATQHNDKKATQQNDKKAQPQAPKHDKKPSHDNKKPAQGDKKHHEEKKQAHGDKKHHDNKNEQKSPNQKHHGNGDKKPQHNDKKRSQPTGPREGGHDGVKKAKHHENKHGKKH